MGKDWEEVENRPWASKRNRSESGCLGQDFVKHSKAVPMRFYWNHKTKRMTGTALFTDSSEGPPGRAHGAAIAMVFDEILAYPVWRLVEEDFGVAVTAELSVSYKAALPLRNTVAFHCRVQRREGRKWWVTGELTKLDDQTVVYATGKALFISLVMGKLSRKNFLKSNL